jgi:NHLM bacteriocin system ABC transporter ATP-binding protein
LKNCRPELTSVLLTGIAGGLIGLVVPVITGNLFDTVIPGAQRGALIGFTWLLLVGGIASALFELTRNLALQRLDGKIGSSLQAAVWDRLLSLPVSFFRQFSAGDLSDRANGIDAIRSTVTGTATNSIVSGIFSVFNLALMFYYSWKLATVGVGLVVLALAATFAFGSEQARRSRPYAKTAGWLSGQVLEFVSGVSKLRASGSETSAYATWAKGYSRQKQLNTRTRTVTNHFGVFQAFLLVFGPMAIFFAVDQWSGRVSTGDFLAFNAAFGQMFSATMTLGSAVTQVMSLKPYFERAMPILTTAAEVSTAKADPGDLNGEIELTGVSFRYHPDTPLVLNDISLRIEPGQFVAFVGPSGCGKSTLLRLLLGFEEPEVGSVFYDGQDLKGLDVNALRRRMGVVLQSGMLFRGDLFSNIVGSKPLTLDDAWEAARLCGLYDEIKQMPMGMHTMVSEGGGGLSGGQRQRVMIARAIVSRPRMLLFDEATSALDNQTQAIVSASLESLKATRIVIAHRLSTILNADRIFVFDHGQLVQSGTYQELIQHEGMFAELARRQLA